MFENNCHDVSNLYKYLERLDPRGEFWSIKPLLTYGKPWFFITSGRSVGKSTNVACFLVLDYLINGYAWLYVRRRKDDVLNTAESFFENAITLLNDRCSFDIEYIEYKGAEYFIKLKHEDKPRKCGESMPLSLEHKYKSNVYNSEGYKTGTILYDEFLPKETTEYLGSYYTNPELEYTKFNELYGTVDREIGKPFLSATRAIFLGNTSTLYNPLFIGTGITAYICRDDKAKIVSPKDKVWILNRVKRVKATQNFERSILYSVSGESDRRYNFENDGGDDYNNSFIKKCERIDATILLLRLKGSLYRVLRNESDFYIEQYKGQPYSKVYSLDLSSHIVDDFRLILQWHNDPKLSVLQQSFLRKALFFDTPKTKREFMTYLSLIS